MFSFTRLSLCVFALMHADVIEGRLPLIESDDITTLQKATGKAIFPQEELSLSSSPTVAANRVSQKQLSPDLKDMVKNVLSTLSSFDTSICVQNLSRKKLPSCSAIERTIVSNSPFKSHTLQLLNKLVAFEAEGCRESTQALVTELHRCTEPEINITMLDLHEEKIRGAIHKINPNLGLLYDVTAAAIFGSLGSSDWLHDVGQIRAENVLADCHIDMLTRINFVQSRFRRGSGCVNRAEETASSIIGWIPIIGTIYDLTSSVVYAAKGCTNVAKERAIGGTIGVAMDFGSVLTLGTGAAAFQGIKAAVKVGVKAGVKTAFKTGLRTAFKSAKKLIPKLLKQTAKSYKNPIKGAIKETLDTVKMVYKLPKSIYRGSKKAITRIQRLRTYSGRRIRYRPRSRGKYGRYQSSRKLCKRMINGSCKSAIGVSGAAQQVNSGSLGRLREAFKVDNSGRYITDLAGRRRAYQQVYNDMVIRNLRSNKELRLFIDSMDGGTKEAFFTGYTSEIIRGQRNLKFSAKKQTQFAFATIMPENVPVMKVAYPAKNVKNFGHSEHQILEQLSKRNVNLQDKTIMLYTTNTPCSGPGCLNDIINFAKQHDKTKIVLVHDKLYTNYRYGNANLASWKKTLEKMKPANLNLVDVHTHEKMGLNVRKRRMLYF